MSKRVFQDVIGNPYGYERPREGDLLYLPMMQKPFEIRFVEGYKPFYQMSQLPMYILTCELYEYSHEVFNTGIQEIDAIQMRYSLNMIDWALHDEAGNALITEDGRFLIYESFDLETVDPPADNEAIQTAADDFLDFSEIDPLAGGDGTY